MNFKQLANTVAVTTFVITPSYVSQIAPTITIQTDSSSATIPTEINFVQQETEKVKDFISEIYSDTKLLLKLKRYDDDLDYTYVSIYSSELSIKELFNMEERLNEYSAEVGKNLVFTVGE